MDSEEHRVMNRLRIVVHSSSSDSDREDDGGEMVVARKSLPLTRSHHSVALGNKRKRLLSKQQSMKETSREIKWEKRRRQIQRQGSMLVTNEGQQLPPGGGLGRSPVEGRTRPMAVPASARCLTDGDLEELRGSFELGFGFDEEKGGGNLRRTLPALDFYFAVNRQLSDPKLKTLYGSPTSTLSPSSSSSNLSGTPSPRSPAPSGDAWTIFNPGANPQLIKTRLRHWAQVVACSVKHNS